MKVVCVFGTMAMMAASAVVAQGNQPVLVVTASNTASNQLLVYDTGGNLIQTVPTKGQGGASGNAGGIAAHGSLLAVVNFGSQSVSLFERGGQGFQLRQTISTSSSPLSVVFGHNHLYVLGTTKVESHQLYGFEANGNADGAVPLLLADGTAAQVGLVENQLILTEKNNMIETVALDGNGAVSGAATLVQGIPANVNTPFGMVTSGNNAYVTIAHADQVSLVRNGKVLTTTPTTSFSGPLQHSPCWLTLVGPFLYASNSPSMSISRYAVYGQKIVPDAGVVATLNGSPTDIASGDNLVAVIDGSGHLSIFGVDQDGNLAMLAVASISSAANGVAVIGPAARQAN